MGKGGPDHLVANELSKAFPRCVTNEEGESTRTSFFKLSRIAKTIASDLKPSFEQASEALIRLLESL